MSLPFGYSKKRLLHNNGFYNLKDIRNTDDINLKIGVFNLGSLYLLTSRNNFPLLPTI